MEKTIFLLCEESPKPNRKGFLTKDFSIPKPSADAQSRHGKTWKLVLGDRQVRLLDDADNEMLLLPREKADAAIRLPFTQWDPKGVVNLGITADAGEYFWFKPDRAIVSQIREYLDESILWQGPEAFASFRKAAWRDFAKSCAGLIGLLVLVILLGCFFWFPVWPENRESIAAARYVFIGAVGVSLLFGIARLAKAGRDITRVRRLQARQKFAGSA
jgi:hypothetical protein